MREYPLRQFWSRLLGINLDFGPIRVLQQIGIGKAQLLSTRCTNEAEVRVSMAKSPWGPTLWLTET